MKNVIILPLLIVLALISACSKSPGKTSSKIKIVSGNFAALLTNKANNGLFFYGKSNDGKVFTKKVDTDTIDLIFPNGTWNFYAVSYELGVTPAAGTLPNFTGKTYCGKTTTTLNGTDASIQIDLTNAGCNDPAFSNSTVYDAGIYKLPKIEVMNCKSLSTLSSGITSCDNISSSKFNKGYASSYRIVALESKNFGEITAPSKIAQSECIISTYANDAAVSSNGGSLFTDFHIPTISNGLMLAIEVFYSNGTSPMATAGCDGSHGVDVVPLQDGPRMKLGIDNASIPRTAHLFVKTDPSDVCRDVRMSAGAFASGNGYPGNPYTVCNKDQLNLMRTNYSSYQVSSIELLTDIDYGMTQIQPIGPALQDAGGATGTPDGWGASAAYAPRFLGNNHKISNFMIDCKTAAGTAPNFDVGFFRKIEKGTIRDLTFNNAVVFCDDGDNVGVLAGKVQATSQISIENIKIHGHTDGRSNIGALVGYWAGFGGDLGNIHIKGDYGGKNFVGGVAGYFDVTSTSTMNRSSFFGSIYGNNNGGGSVDISKVGGLFGYANSSASAFSISKSIVKAKRIEASSVVGSFIGEANNVSITDSYSTSVLVASGNTDGSATFAKIGGAIGAANNIVLSNTFVVDTFKSSNRGPSDHTLGGLIGTGTGVSCSTAYYSGEHDASNSTSCGSTLTFAQSRDQSFYSSLGFILPVKLGMWDAVNNLPLLNSSCSPGDTGKYYEVSNINVSSFFGSVLPGDIILCNGSSNIIVALTSIEDTFTNDPYTWRMLDNTYDIPRLSWEEKVENFLPYLKRECHGHFATQFGSGTQADPKWICDYTQFTNMSAGQYYVLKNDIVMDISSHTPLPAGQYFLKGNKFSLKGFVINLPSAYTGTTDYFGIFTSLLTGSVLEDFDIVASGFYSPNPSNTGGNTLYIGTIAGQNDGTLRNIKMDRAKVPVNIHPGSTDTLFIGGAVGYNNTSGLLTKMEVGADVELAGGAFTGPSQKVFGGGVVGKNMGVVEGVRGHASFNRALPCPTSLAVIPFGTGETIGGFAGTNANLIKEVDHDGELRANVLQGSSFNDCNFALGLNTTPFIGSSIGTVQDFYSNPRTWLNNSFNDLIELFGNGSSGTITRGFVELDSSKSFVFLPGTTFTLLGTWDPFTNPYTGAPTPACPAADTGKWYDVTAASGGANSLGVPLFAGDRVVCNGLKNIILSADSFTKVSTASPAMSDVIFIVKDPGGSCSNSNYFSQTECTNNSGSWSSGTSPSLPADRYYDKNLSFSVGTGLKVETITPAAVLFDHNTWSVATDFLNPGTKTWTFWYRQGASVSPEPPELVKAKGGLEDLGAPFN